MNLIPKAGRCLTDFERAIRSYLMIFMISGKPWYAPSYQWLDPDHSVFTPRPINLGSARTFQPLGVLARVWLRRFSSRKCDHSPSTHEGTTFMKRRLFAPGASVNPRFRAHEEERA